MTYNVYDIRSIINCGVVTSATPKLLFNNFESVDEIERFFSHIPKSFFGKDTNEFHIMKMDGDIPVACEGMIFNF